MNPLIIKKVRQKLSETAKGLIPRFYREYKGGSDWWHSVKIDGNYYDLNYLTHDPMGTGSFPARKRHLVNIWAYNVITDKDSESPQNPQGLRQVDRGSISLGYFKGKKTRELIRS
jgi:hypothetical protein